MDQYLGEIRYFAGSKPPKGWLICDGTMLRQSEFHALFSLIGKTYGGNSHEFAIPDYRGRLTVGAQPQKDAPGSYHLGDTGGAETSTMTEETLPTHTHAYPINSASGPVTASSTPAVYLDPKENSVFGAVQSLATTNPGEAKQYVGPAAADTVGLGGLAAFTDGDDLTGITGDGEARTNLMPYVVINAIIAVEGVM